MIRRFPKIHDESAPGHTARPERRKSSKSKPPASPATAAAGALGHPRVYLEMGDENFVECPYCDRRFVLGRSRSRIMSAPLTGLKKGDHLYLVDGSGYLFRAYHALPPLTRKSDGLPTGAVSGYLQHAVEAARGHEGRRRAHPSRGHLRRRQDDLPQRHLPRIQGQPARAARRSDPAIPAGARCDPRLRRRLLEMPGYEADDLIATYARLAREAGARVTIVSSDKDLMQLVVDGTVNLLDTMKNKRIGAAEVIERFGVPPAQGGRGAGAGRRFDRQCAGRSRHRGQDRGRADQHISAISKRCCARGRDQAAQAARKPDRQCATMARISLKLVTLDDHVPLTERARRFRTRMSPIPRR